MSLTPRALAPARSFPLPSRTIPGPLSASQSRSASTARRHRKLLNIAPHPSHGGAPPNLHPTSLDSAPRLDSLPRLGSTGRSRLPKSLVGQALLAAGDRIIYAPPSSAPSPFQTPLKFLPSGDPRRAYLERQRAAAPSSSATDAGTGGEMLPKPVRQPYQKTYHMSAESIEEMRRLRQSDENKWTRTRLAEKFGCTQFFVSLVVQASEQRLASLRLENRAIVESWGRKRRTARLDRARRRELWERDE